MLWIATAYRSPGGVADCAAGRSRGVPLISGPASDLRMAPTVPSTTCPLRLHVNLPATASPPSDDGDVGQQPGEVAVLGDGERLERIADYRLPTAVREFLCQAPQTNVDGVGHTNPSSVTLTPSLSGGIPERSGRSVGCPRPGQMTTALHRRISGPPGYSDVSPDCPQVFHPSRVLAAGFAWCGPAQRGKAVRSAIPCKEMKRGDP